MHSDLTFKSCSPSDIDNLVQVSQQFYPEHYRHIWKNDDPSYYINLSFNRKAFEQDFKDQNIEYFLVMKANEILGLIKIRKHEKINHFQSSEAMQLEKIYLLKKSIGQGIGQKGLNFIKTYALSLHKKAIWLDAMTTSPALVFYQKNNFNTVSYYDLTYPGLKDGYREMQRMILVL